MKLDLAAIRARVDAVTRKCMECDAVATCNDGDGPVCRAHCGNDRCKTDEGREPDPIEDVRSLLDEVDRLRAALADTERDRANYRDAWAKSVNRAGAMKKTLSEVSANCDHTNDCDRAADWATNDTPCSCVMRDVEAALEGE
jgi:hypothetical protein